MIPTRLKKFLKTYDVDYELIQHPDSWTPHQIALQERLSEQEVAKVRVVKAGNKDVMVVVPSSCEVDLEKLKDALDEEFVALETREEFRRLFPDCDPSALPALGSPYNMKCFVDETLLDGADVVFDAGNHHDGIKMSSDEYWRAAQAEIGDFRTRKKG